MISAENYVEAIKNKSEFIIIDITKSQMFTGGEDSEKDLGVKFKNLVTGDTDSIFLCYKHLIDKTKSNDEKLKYVVELNKEVQTFLNEKIVKHIISKHNVPENKNRLELKNELVIKRGLYLAKKRYANYILTNEGNPVSDDKAIKAMGLEIKRSDFAKITKDYLKDTLNLVLKEEVFSLPKVMNFVKDKEKLFLDLANKRITSLGRPVSFSKKIEEYKVIPQGVRGMLTWNNLEFKVFDVGSRGYLFPLKGIDLYKAPEEVRKNYDEYFLKNGKKLDIIVIPEETQIVPLYYIIDIKTMVDFAWTDRYKLLLDPLLTKKQEVLTF